jgi:hypothetical protein
MNQYTINLENIQYNQRISEADEMKSTQWSFTFTLGSKDQ